MFVYESSHKQNSIGSDQIIWKIHQPQNSKWQKNREKEREQAMTADSISINTYILQTDVSWIEEPMKKKFYWLL